MMSDEELKKTVDLTLLAIKQFDLPVGESCKHCDPEVGYQCPECCLCTCSGDLARHCLGELKKKGRS